VFACGIAAIFSTVILAADGAAAPGIGKQLDGQIRSVEREVVSLAEAMPADKYNFAPTGAAFEGVRTFSQQMSHIAAVVYLVSSAAMGEKPIDPGPNENGPATLDGKDAVVKYLKDAFAYAHKAANSLTDANANELMPPPFGKNKTSRWSDVDVAVWHSFDHYGQAVVYARMNGIVPPASRPQ